MSVSVGGACVRPAGAQRITPAYDLRGALVRGTATRDVETNFTKLQASENTCDVMELNDVNKHPQCA